MTLLELWTQAEGLLPELTLSVTLCAVIVADMFAPLRRSMAVCGWLSLAGTLTALGVVAARLPIGGRGSGGSVPGLNALTFFGAIVHDEISVFFHVLFLLGAAAIVLFSLRSRETAGYRQGEYYSLLLGAVLGACFLVSADNILVFVLGFETLSLCSYVLAGFVKHERLSAEASLKYMIYGAVTSGVMLFGLSYLYGLTGTLAIGDGMGALRDLSAAGGPQRLALMMIFVLVLAGIGFKIAMAPFHFWCPDVYQGSPTPVTAFLSVVSTAAGFGALLRLLLPFFMAAPAGPAAHDLPVLFGVFSVATMTLGNLVAIRQTDVKRLLAYSSIAHAGYMLLGLTVYTPESLEAILFYLFVYLFMNLGAFWIVVVLVNRLGGPQIGLFRGVAAKAPFLFFALFVFLIALTGLPPTAGFVGKFMLFKVVVGAGISHMQAADGVGGGGQTPMSAFYIALALATVLNSVVSLYYYMKIARVMVFEKAAEADADRVRAGIGEERALGDDFLDRAGAALFLAPTLGLLYFAPVLDLIRWSAR
jgi:NADH-quinone oxidoreductase subunit N